MAVHKKYSRNVLGRGLDDIDGGKGLDALFDNAGARTEGTSTINEIPLSQIEANPNQQPTIRLTTKNNKDNNGRT